MKYRSEYQQMLEAWGEDSQLEICIEEMSELIKALCKYKRKKRLDEVDSKCFDSIREEIADVTHCILQMALMFGEEEVNKIMDDKLVRTMKKLG